VWFLLGGQRWVEALIAPAFVLPITVGALAAYMMRKHLSKGSYFVWIIPLALLLWALWAVINSPYSTPTEIWGTMVGTDCGSSECLYEAFFTVPFVCAISYSLSSAVAKATMRPRSVSSRSLHN
jgi:uncharacterized membrane protein YoaK (UPF0700 family)